MRILITLISVLVLSLSPPALAAGPFGIELGKTTLQDIGAHYKITSAGNNYWTDGPMYRVTDISDLGVSDLTDFRIVLNKDDVVVATLLKFPKSKFGDLNSYAAERFKLVEKTIPFVGNKTARYRDGDSIISLNAPHLRFDMEMDYVHDSFIETRNLKMARDAKEKKLSEKSALFGK